MTSRKRDITPLFWAFGGAVYEGQHLEHGLQLLLSLIDHELKVKGKTRVRLTVDSPNAHKKLGELFDEVQSFEYITDAERKIIQKGLKTRNFLVHAYWQGDRIAQMNSPTGRKAIFTELDDLREVCRKAGRLVDSFIDEHLAKAGTSLDELSRPLWDKWQSDEIVH
jgi:hypothetical protein